MRYFALLTCLLVLAQPLCADININEVFFDDAQASAEYVELISDTGGVESLDDVWLLQFDADIVNNPGVLVSALDLTGFSTGTNGLFLWREVAPGLESNPPQLLPLPERETVVQVGSNGFGKDGLLKGPMVMLLVKGFHGELGFDLDVDDNRVIDDTFGVPWDSTLIQHGRDLVRRELRPLFFNYAVGVDIPEDPADITPELEQLSLSYFWGLPVPRSAVLRAGSTDYTGPVAGDLPGPYEVDLSLPVAATGGFFDFDLRIGERIRQLTPGRDNEYVANLFADCNQDDVIGLDDLSCADGASAVEGVLVQLGFYPGDFDLDGAVNFTDFVTLAANFDGEGTYASGDADGSGRIDFQDFVILAANYADAGGAAASVPEPTGFGNAVWWVILAVAHRRTLTRRTREKRPNARTNTDSADGMALSRIRNEARRSRVL